MSTNEVLLPNNNDDDGVSSMTMRNMGACTAFIVLFISASYLAHRWVSVLEFHGLSMGLWGYAFYGFVTASAVVFAPFSSMPLLPLAAALWGPFTAALVSICAWTVGAQLVFELCRGTVRPMLLRKGAGKRYERYAQALTGEHPFITLILLRMIVPVDVLSYVVALFTSIPRRTYFSATVLGVTPFAFVFSYTSTLPWWYQVIMFVGIAFIVWKGLQSIMRCQKQGRAVDSTSS